MPAWCHSSDCQAAQDEIKLEITTRGWDRLVQTSSNHQKSVGDAERRQFVPHLEHAYPDARKDTDVWIKFIKKLTGQVRLCNSASAAYSQASNLPKKDAGLKRKLGKGLSQEDPESQSKAWSSVPQKKSLWPGKSMCCVCALT